VQVSNLLPDSLQTERVIKEYLEILKQEKDVCIDISGQTDFAFVLSVIACARNYQTKITGVLFDKIKDAEKMTEFVYTLNRLGANVKYAQGEVVVNGTGGFKGGIMVDSLSDGRIAASLIIASTVCSQPITLLSAEYAGIDYCDIKEMLQLISAETKLEVS
jgi:3-phosphoshikimate 1-carboxyvinyltransferase